MGDAPIHGIQTDNTTLLDRRNSPQHKIDSLAIIVTSPPAPGWGGRYWILIKLTTACGITGWGEVYAASVGPEAMRAVIGDVFEPVIAHRCSEAGRPNLSNHGRS